MCDGCTPGLNGRESHYNLWREVELSHMSPDTGTDPCTLEQWHEQQTRKAYIAQRHGALMPTIRLAKGDLIADEVMLTLREAENFVDHVGDLVIEAKAAWLGRTIDEQRKADTPT
jgi:hypothetical protein